MSNQNSSKAATFEATTDSKRIQDIESWLQCPACGAKAELKAWKSIGFKCINEDCGRYLKAFDVESMDGFPDRPGDVNNDLLSYGGESDA